jgi:hypothetical protein
MQKVGVGDIGIVLGHEVVECIGSVESVRSKNFHKYIKESLKAKI